MQIFFMLEVHIHKDCVKLLKINFLTCPTRMGGPKLALRRSIRDLGHHVQCTYTMTRKLTYF